MKSTESTSVHAMHVVAHAPRPAGGAWALDARRLEGGTRTAEAE